MAYPREIAGTQVCIRVSADGVTVYGNRKAFKSLAQWMTWIANASEEEHYECVPSACPLGVSGSTRHLLSLEPSRFLHDDLDKITFDSRFRLPSDLFLCLTTSCSSIDDRPHRTTS
jgi:hypothetical protein